MARWLVVTCVWTAACLLSTPARAKAPAQAKALPLQQVALPAGLGERALSLKARRLIYRPGACAARGPAPKQCPSVLELAGDVRLELGKLRVKAARLTVRIDRLGRPASISATRAIVHAADLEGRARKVELSAVADSPTAGGRSGRGLSVVLTGDARLALPRRGIRLAGERIGLNTATGAVAVQRASAELATTAAGRAW